MSVMYMLDETGLTRYTGEFIPNGKAKIAKAIGVERKLVKSAFLMGDDAVDLAIGEDDAVAAIQLKSLSIRTHYLIDIDALVPCFAGNKASCQLEMEWVPPHNMLLTFAVEAKRGPSEWICKDCHLFCRKTGSAGFLLIPLPNTHSTGKLCMGDMQVRSKTIEGVLAGCLKSLRSSTWNADLVMPNHLSKAMFRFDTATRVTLPIQLDWEPLCRKTSSVVMEDLFP